MDKSSIDYAEGRVFSFDDESAMRPDFLQTIDYSGAPAKDQLSNE